MPWMQLRIDAEPGARIGRLLVRGASLCLGYLNQREVFDVCLDADGWFDTGDMVRDDGKGGIRISGRRADLITRATGDKVPTAETEAVLLRHPAVRDVVLVGYADPRMPSCDEVCAVVVPEGEPPTLAALRDHLEREQVTIDSWPDRLEIMSGLPKNELGKILRSAVRKAIEAQARTGRSVLADTREGLRYCRSQRWLWITIGAAGVANLAAFSPLTLLVPLLIRNVLHDGPAVLGLVIASAGAGGVMASLLAGRVGAPRHRVAVMWLGWGVAGAAVASLGLAPNAWVAGLLVAVAWALLMYGNVLWHPLMQQRVPAGLLGRASSVDWLVSFAGSPAGILVAGAAAGSAGPRAVLLAGGCVAALMALVLVLPGVREPDQHQDRPSPAGPAGS